MLSVKVQLLGGVQRRVQLPCTSLQQLVLDLVQRYSGESRTVGVSLSLSVHANLCAFVDTHVQVCSCVLLCVCRGHSRPL